MGGTSKMGELWNSILKEVKKETIKSLEKKLQYLKYEPDGTMVQCPECHYISLKGKFSAKIFLNKETNVRSVKCFACNFWRIIK